MAWQIDELTLQKDAVGAKVGFIKVSWPNAFQAETFEYPVRFQGNTLADVDEFWDDATAAMDEFIARRTAEENLKNIVIGRAPTE